MAFLGHIPDPEGHAEMLAMAPAPLVRESEMPMVHDLGLWMPPRMYQEPFGTCAYHSVIGGARFDLLNSGAPDLELSRLFPCFNVRKKTGTYPADSGARVRDVVESLRDIGTPPEAIWPYDPNRFNDEPPPEAYAAAIQHKALELRAVGTDILSVRAALWTGRPVIIGVNIYKQFESEESFATGMIDMPSAGETPIGAHSVLVDAFNKAAFPGRVSAQGWWSEYNDAGNGHHYFLPEYLSREGVDFWVLSRVSGEAT